MNDIVYFIKNDILPNLPYYLLQIFLIVLMVIVFAFINIVVRFLTDPLCIKVLRMKENKRGPGIVGGAISVVIMVVLLIFAYNTFPQLQPTVIGWTGKTLQKVVHWDWDSLEKTIPAKVKSAPGKIESGAKKAVSKVKSATKSDATSVPPPPASKPPVNQPPGLDGQ